MIALPPDPAPLVLVKVCGLTVPEEARQVAEAGADWIGLNFHPPSPRFVTEAQAARVLGELPAEGVQAVGLFVNRETREIVEIAHQLSLKIVQLHGDEPPEDVATLHEAGLRVVRAFRLRDEAALRGMSAYLVACEQRGAPLDAVLVDAYVAGVPGGTGQSIDAALLERLPTLPRLILAGGLTPENVAERVAAARPWMVDVAGGVEHAPGRKELSKVVAFVKAARAAPRR